MGDDAIIPNDADASKPRPNIAPAPQENPAPDRPAPAASAGAPPLPPAEPVSDAAMKDDIARILEGAKLPERHSPAVSTPEPQKKYDTMLADPMRELPHPDPAYSAPAAASKTPGNEGTDNLGSLHTLKDDLQRVVQENKISYVRAVALEEEKRHRIEERSPVPKPRKHSLAMIFTLILLIGTGALALGAVYIVMQQRSGQPAATTASNILFAEQSVPYPLDAQAPADVRRTLASARTSGALALGSILEIIPVHTATGSSGETTVPATFGEFLTALGTRAPADLPRALGDSFFFGIHAVDENAPIIVVPVTSYERAFAAMLAWEPYMNADLEPLFTQLPPQTRTANGLVTERTFEDAVMRNYDVRELKDDSGVVQLYYSFPTRNILIIAESPYSFAEILSRLRADRRL